jgi:hypothetical protein
MSKFLFFLGVGLILLGCVIQIYVNILPAPPGTPNIISDYVVFIENWPLSLGGLFCWFFGAFLCASQIRH